MAVSQKVISSLLFATFVLGNVVCLCDVNAAVGSMDTAQHAHHATESETTTSHGCPHTDCDGECASLTGIAAEDTALMLVPRTIELEDPAALPVTSAVQMPFAGNHLHTVSVRSPPLQVSDTPVSRFDRLLD